MSTIITKSVRTFLGVSMPEYYKLTIVNNRVVETELTSTEAKNYIKENNLPIIHKLDHNNIIWGDKNFKRLCPRSFKMKQHENAAS